MVLRVFRFLSRPQSILNRAATPSDRRWWLSAAVSLLLWAALCTGQTVAPSVTKVEPPSWWAGHTINPVRLLVRGQNLNGARVLSNNRALQVSEVFVNRTGTYLFVNVSINSKTRRGSYPLKLITPQGSTTIPFTLEAPLATSTHFQGVTANDVIYLIMPDRFADGDQANNAPANVPAAANDRKNPRAYHGGDLRGIINHLPYLKDLGITALWLNPWY